MGDKFEGEWLLLLVMDEDWFLWRFFNFFWWREWIWQLSTGLSMFLENFGNGQWEMSWGVITMQYHVQEFERVLGNCANMALFHFLWHIDKNVFCCCCLLCLIRWFTSPITYAITNFLWGTQHTSTNKTVLFLLCSLHQMVSGRFCNTSCSRKMAVI